MRILVLLIPLFIFLRLNQRLSRPTARFYSLLILVKIGASWITTTSIVVKTWDATYYVNSGVAIANRNTNSATRLLLKNAGIQLVNAGISFVPGPGSILLTASLLGALLSIVAYQLVSLAIEAQKLRSLSFAITTGIFPSLLFWNSGNFKEPYVTLGLSIGFYYVLKSKYLFAMGGLGIATLFRPQLASLCLVFVFSIVLLRKPRQTASRALKVAMALASLAVAASFVLENHIRRPQDFGGGSDLEPVWTSRFLWKALPRALFATDPWRRPTTLAQIIQILSGLFLILLIANTLRSFRKPTINSVGLMAGTWGISSCYLLALTVDNAGTLDRYRSPYLVFLIASLSFAREQKLKKDVRPGGRNTKNKTYNSTGSPSPLPGYRISLR